MTTTTDKSNYDDTALRAWLERDRKRVRESLEKNKDNNNDDDKRAPTTVSKTDINK